jgi:hypothetical protein
MESSWVDGLGWREKPSPVRCSSTTIDPCLSSFPWAVFRKTKAAVSMHTLMDLRGGHRSQAADVGCFAPFHAPEPLGHALREHAHPASLSEDAEERSHPNSLNQMILFDP